MPILSSPWYSSPNSERIHCSSSVNVPFMPVIMPTEMRGPVPAQEIAQQRRLAGADVAAHDAEHGPVAQAVDQQVQRHAVLAREEHELLLRQQRERLDLEPVERFVHGR